ncbi:MAG: ABC transporter ATP-binding protein [Desulfobacterales bacterium]|nr:ABC transporter ATP-binding protein [Desulfobacterales bacterium]MBF0395582.1 ABC transporter ATP-binding protein [Desulfobacterales bacterium]
MNIALEVKKMTMDFGGLRAIDNLDLDVKHGEIVALIGPNGAGKTTFFNCITGVYRPTRGDILIYPPDREQLRINGLKSNNVTEKGMARTFQNIRLFPNMTVLENVMIGRHCRTKSGVFSAIFRSRKTIHEENDIVEKSYNILEKIGIERFVNEFAKNLPYGVQRKLEIARALATDPFILLLDEPAAGMNPIEIKELDELIKKIRKQEKLSILLIEHHMSLVMNLSDRIFVMDYGRKIAQGTPDEIKSNKDVIKAYLGEDSDA